MTPQISELIEKIRALEGELDAELAKRRAVLRSGWSMAVSHSRRNFCGAIASCARSCCPICWAPIRWWC